jgi:DNA-binding NarL/FixJ family response regulator
MTVTVLLVDDEVLFRSGLGMVLSVQPELRVIGEASNGAEALTLTRRLRPDVVLMDLIMPVMDGVEATSRLTADDFTVDPDYTAKVLILTALAGDENVFAALRAGASGFVLKDTAPVELAAAIDCVAKGNGYLAPSITPGVIAGLTAHTGAVHPAAGVVDRLTAREREILVLVAHGLTNDAISARLNLAMGTVKTHVCRILMRLEVHDRAQAVVAAYQSGLVVPGEGPPGGPSPG